MGLNHFSLCSILCRLIGLLTSHRGQLLREALMFESKMTDGRLIPPPVVINTRGPQRPKRQMSGHSP